MATQQQDTINPIVEVGLVATENDRFYYRNPEVTIQDDIQYIGLYHRHFDGTLMAGEGVLGEVHAINPSKIIAGTIEYTPAEDIQEVREIVSDLFYKLWFVEYTLTDEQILSMQTTIRDGKKQTGRAESEPLVFYKKDRNTLENRQDLQGDEFESICQDIFDNTIIDMEGMFDIYEPPEEPTNSPEDNIEPNTYWNLKKYIMQYTNGQTSYDVVIAEELIKYHDDLLPPDSDNTDTQENF